MVRISVRFLLALLCLAAVSTLAAKTVELNQVQFPEKRTVELPFTVTSIAPDATVTASVRHKKGQSEIDIAFYDMKPAILFGGDVSCYVVWAVTRDGQAENLGELLTRRVNGNLEFATGKKAFALMVTAESFYLVNRPSELVVLYNRPAEEMVTGSSPFTYDDFDPAPRHSMDAIAHIKWDSKVPLELLQARKAFEVSGRNAAQTHAPQIYSEAHEAVNRANQIAQDAPRSRELVDAARRAVALSNEALNISRRKIEAAELERKVAERRAETEALEKRAAEAEAAAREAEQLAVAVSAQAERVREEKERMLAETEALREEKATMERALAQLAEDKTMLQGESSRLLQEKTTLASEKSALEAKAETLKKEKLAVEASALKLQHEKNALSGRLQSALSHVADTKASARGLVVNLPDILFDTNEADLKPEAQVVLAKLAGILLILADQDVMVEGHTDATGSPEYNLDLSQRRAIAVLEFLTVQGLGMDRIDATGFGMERPVADNATAEGRRQNRRVEIVISERGERVASN